MHGASHASSLRRQPVRGPRRRSALAGRGRAERAAPPASRTRAAPPAAERGRAQAGRGAHDGVTDDLMFLCENVNVAMWLAVTGEFPMSFVWTVALPRASAPENPELRLCDCDDLLVAGCAHLCIQELQQKSTPAKSHSNPIQSIALQFATRRRTCSQGTKEATSFFCGPNKIGVRF